MSRFRDPPLRFSPDYLGLQEQNELFDWLLVNCSWQQEEIRVYGRLVRQPRLTAWFGLGLSAGSSYSLPMQAHMWGAPMAALKQKVEDTVQQSFNSCLANYYRNGQDSVAWHADDESALGPTPVVASVSLGAARDFRLKRKDDPHVKASVELTGGSLLVMEAGFQEEWLHCVPKRARLLEPRINLTFRNVKVQLGSAAISSSASRTSS